MPDDTSKVVLNREIDRKNPLFLSSIKYQYHFPEN
jgi:hypothetical protein